MHPRVFLDGFWRNDLWANVFVAMSFDPEYDHRWLQIFVPAIEDEPFGALALKATRTDVRRSGDSILSEITNGIAHAQLVLADISVTDRWEENGKKKWARNGNVMYEVGLALACRQPVEVILMRDDDDHLLFDVSHIPVLRFDENAIDASIELIRNAIADRLRERQLVKDLRVAVLLESLSPFEISVISENAHLEVMAWKSEAPLGAIVQALPSLLQKHVLRLAKPRSTAHNDAYTWTAFGREVADLVAKKVPRGTQPPR